MGNTTNKNVVFENMAFINGKPIVANPSGPEHGGAIWAVGVDTLTLERCVFRENETYNIGYGGAIYGAAFAQQGPGGVGAFSSWQQGSNNAELVNNYATIDLLDFTANTDVDALALEGASTMFFVLQAKQPTQTGALFLRLGDISVYDDHITYGRGSVSLTSKHNQEPRIIAIEMQRPQQCVTRQ